MHCPKCGKINEDSLFCTGCGTKLNNERKSVVTLCENEREVRVYHTTNFQDGAKGYLTITNKRVIYHSYSEKCMMLSEVQLEKVSGVSTHFGKGFIIRKIVLTILLSLLALFGIWLDNPFVVIGFALLAAFVASRARMTCYYLGVYADGASLSPIHIGTGLPTHEVTGQSATLLFQGSPSDEITTMMDEIGAIILDFKTLGDFAFERWEKKSDVDTVSAPVVDALAVTDDNIFG